jgi:hypothetical protein
MMVTVGEFADSQSGSQRIHLSFYCELGVHGEVCVPVFCTNPIVIYSIAQH